MTAPVTPGDRFARARVEFEQAMAAGCTIPELRRRKRAWAHRAQADAASHTADLMTQPPAQRDYLAWEAGYMMRD